MFHVKQSAPSVSRETQERLATYERLLLEWNPRINLIARSSTASVGSRHFDDSLQLLPFFAHDSAAAIDVGSGGGFPGLVLCIATGIPFTLIEADIRKAAFLREVARMTEAPARIVSQRAEAVTGLAAPIVTARALAPLPQLLALCHPLLSPGGTMLLLKGAGVEAEITAALRNWTMRIERHISSTSEGGVILRISEVERVRT